MGRDRKIMTAAFLRRCALALLLPLVGSGSAFAQQVLKFNHTNAPGESRDRAAEFFAKKVKEYTGGRYRVLVFHSGQLGADAASLEELSKGKIDFQVSAVGIYGGKNKALNLTALPYLVDNYEQGWKFYDESKWIKRQFDSMPAQGVRILGVWEAGFRSFTTKSPLRSPADAEGKTIRIFKNEMLQWIMEAIGYKTKTMGVTDAYVAIGRGEVEGQENPIDTIVSQRFYEVAPYVTLTRHIYSPLLVSVSERTWQKLSPADQNALRKAAMEASNLSRVEVRDQEERQLIEMQGKGAKITRPEIAPFRRSIEGVYEKARGEFGKEVDAILADAELVRK